MKPNILFIIADDLNAWIGALGRHPQVKTPHMDALARRGSLFVNAYCSAPYCNASRMGMFTGLLPSTLGVYQNENFWDQPNRPLTFVEILQAAGYHTFGAGKVFHGTFDYETAGRESLSVAPWREAENRPHLWDSFASLSGERLPTGRPLNGLFDFSNFSEVPRMYHLFDWGPSPTGADADLPDAKTVEAVSNFLETARHEPFFCAAGLYKPHLPWHAPGRFFDLYPRDEISLPLVRKDDLDDVPPIGRRWALTPPDHELVTSRGVWIDAVRGYLACISYADELVGKLVAALERSGATNRTMVILCGDNGFHLGEKLHWRKFALWEEATRVPLICVPPEPASAQRIIEPVSLTDIYPTVLDYAGISTRGTNDSFSLRQMMKDPEAASRPKSVIMTWGQGNHSIRTRRWRFTRYSDGESELYDHAADPHEWTNLAKYLEYVSVRDRLSAEIDRQCSGAG